MGFRIALDEWLNFLSGYEQDESQVEKMVSDKEKENTVCLRNETWKALIRPYYSRRAKHALKTPRY